MAKESLLFREEFYEEVTIARRQEISTEGMRFTLNLILTRIQKTTPKCPT